MTGFGRLHSAAHRRRAVAGADGGVSGVVTSTAPLVIELSNGAGRVTDESAVVAAHVTVAVDDRVVLLFVQTAYVVIGVLS